MKPTRIILVIFLITFAVCCGGGSIGTGVRPSPTSFRDTNSPLKRFPYLGKTKSSCLEGFTLLTEDHDSNVKVEGPDCLIKLSAGAAAGKITISTNPAINKAYIKIEKVRCEISEGSDGVFAEYLENKDGHFELPKLEWSLGHYFRIYIDAHAVTRQLVIDRADNGCAVK